MFYRSVNRFYLTNTTLDCVYYFFPKVEYGEHNDLLTQTGYDIRKKQLLRICSSDLVD